MPKSIRDGWDMQIDYDDDNDDDDDNNNNNNNNRNTAHVECKNKGYTGNNWRRLGPFPNHSENA